MTCTWLDMTKGEVLSQFGKSLLGSVLWRVLPLSISVLIGIWIVVIVISERSLEEETYNRIVEKSDALAMSADAKISNVLNVVRNLAASNLIVNALIDVESGFEVGGEDEQASYMDAFFRTLRVAGLRDVKLKVLDYRGRTIVNSGEAQDYQDELWVDVVMEGGEHLYIDSEKRQLTFATPISYNGGAEGILLLEVERQVFLEYLGSQLPMGAVLLRTHDNAVLYSALWGVDDELSFIEPPDSDPNIIEYQLPLRLFPVITLRYGEERVDAFATLDELHSTLLLVLVLDLIALVTGIVIAGRSVASPVKEFTEQLANHQDEPEQHVELRQAGVLEVDQLVQTYNQLQEVARSLNRELHAQYEMTSQVFSAMGDALVVVDDKQSIVDVNPAAVRLLGGDGDQLLGSMINRYILEGEGDEVIVRSGDGEEIPVIRSVSHSSDGHYVVWVLHDLSERKKAEQQEQYAAFQSGIAEMGASVLHNIGNAITGMVGHVSNLSKQYEVVKRLSTLLQEQVDQYSGKQASDKVEGRKLEDEFEHLLEILRQSSRVLDKMGGEQGIPLYLDRLSHAIHHIGEVITIQQSAARPVVHATNFPLGAMVNDTLGLLEDSLSKHRISTVLELDPKLPILLLPRNPMIQLLLNLLKNSMESIVGHGEQEATTDGEIILNARQIDSHWFELLVMDNGEGLESERLEEVFQPRVSSKKRGSGYGLHSAANFVVSMGGEIRLESEGKGAGATVRLKLPIRVQEEMGAGGPQVEQG